MWSWLRSSSRDPRQEEWEESREDGSEGEETRTYGPEAPARSTDGGGRPPPDPETGITVGERLGRYLVLYRLGSGGMGVVYAAFDLELRRRVALKLMRRAGPSGAPALSSLEARAMARLVHPNTVTVYDLGVEGDRVFLAMELVSGVTLGEWLGLRRRGWREVLEVLVRAGQGLAAAHREGIVHQDFKPSNVMISENGEVKVLDFGLARLLGPEPGAESTHSGATSPRGGTPGFMAPEQIEGREPAPAADQYSFCATLARSLFGSRAVIPSAPDAVGGPGDRAPLPRVAGRVPGWLRRALRRGLAVRPADRFASMDDLLAAISLQRHRARTWVGLGIGLAAVAAAGLVLLVRSANRPAPCGGAAQAWVGVWDDGQRELLRRGARAARSAAVSEAVRFVESSLDRYVLDWSREYVSACRATTVHRDQSEEVLDLRMACLEDRRAEARALVHLLAEGGSEELLQAPAAVGRLRPPGPCGERSELVLLAPVPERREAEIQKIRTSVERQRARLRFGREPDPAVLRRAADQARALPYRPLEAQALFVLGGTLDREGESERAESVYEEALLAALASGDRVTQAEIAIRLIYLTGYHLPDRDVSAWWSRYAEAAVEPLGDARPELRVLLEGALGHDDWAAGRADEAGEHYRRALTTMEKAPAIPVSRAIVLLNNAALAFSGEQAIESLERALRLSEGFGSSSPLLARPLANLASQLAIHGRFEEALRRMRRSLELSRAHLGPDHREIAYPLVGVGQILLRMDRAVEAEESLAAGVELAEAGFGEDHFLPALFRVDLAEALLLQGLEEEATRQLERAASSLAGQEPGAPMRRPLDAMTGYLFARIGRSREAEDLLAATSNGPEAKEPRTEVLEWLARGRARLDLGSTAAAVDALEHALERSGPWSRPRLEAEVGFLLARAVRRSDPERALRLADEAEAMLEGDDPVRRRLAAEIAAWRVDAFGS